MLSILPLEQRQIFDEQLCHILSSLNGAEQDFMLPLWCFGIVLCAERPGYIDTKHRSRQASERIDHDSHSECTWNFAAGRKLFGSTSKVHKTISLTYLGVVWATKGGVGIAEEEAIEGIQIAYKILSFIDPGSLKAWPTSSSLAKNSFPKLLSKALQAVNPVIQVYASAIYAMVAPGTSLPSEILVGYEDSMMRVILGKTSVDLAQAVSTSFLVYAVSKPTYC